MKLKGIIIIIVLLGVSNLFKSCTNEPVATEKKAKNVILMIGDGMGVTQIYAAMSIAEKPLNIEKFKHIGFHKTYSASDYITDSGAGGTALSTGEKTLNHYIGLDSLGKPLKTILDYAYENNLSTGLISTSAITHATPASFIAHEKDRYAYEDIAKDFLDFDINLFIGGGKDHFSKRKDELNLIDSLKVRNYYVIDGIENLDINTKGKFAVFTADFHDPKMSEGRGNVLPVATEKATEILNKDKDGFFLMIEGSQIDWGGHDNDIDYVTSELIDFDNAVGKALDFAKKDGNTLVIVTADHETGGLAITGGDMKKKTIEVKFAKDDHTAVMVPVFAYGPGSENFEGIYENTDVFKKMIDALGIKIKSN